MEQSYVQYIFHTGEQFLKEILIAELSAIGFDGFEERNEKLFAFISFAALNEKAVKSIGDKYSIKFSKEFIEEQNWNALWESNFQPVIIGDKVAIRANFHQPIKNVLHEIIITPKMSFGTGHHATTYMMMEQMCTLNFRNKTVFDFGTGTGVLAILAEKLGASLIKAIDNDDRSIENAAENISQNNCRKIILELNDKPSSRNKYDVVLANINRNIITENFSQLVPVMQTGAHLLISGLLVNDEESVIRLALAAGLHLSAKQNRGDWILLQFNKN